MPTIAIDPNLRIDNNNTLAGFEDLITGSLDDLHPGTTVEVREPESGLTGTAQIVHLDPDRQLITLTVDWTSLNPTTSK